MSYGRLLALACVNSNCSEVDGASSHSAVAMNAIKCMTNTIMLEGHALGLRNRWARLIHEGWQQQHDGRHQHQYQQAYYIYDPKRSHATKYCA